MSLKLYVDMMSQPCRSVILFCRVNNIQYEPVTKLIFGGDLATEEFAKITPLKTVSVNYTQISGLINDIFIQRFLPWMMAASSLVIPALS